MSNISNNIFLYIGILASTNCFCQGKNSNVVTDVSKATFFNPGISYEKGIGKAQLLYAQLFMNTSFAIGYSDALGNTSYIHFDPAATLQYRYYYNSEKRVAKGKRTEMNSLNYVSFITDITVITERFLSVGHIETNHPAIKEFGIAWGLQRNYKGRFSLDLNVGPGYFFAKVAKQNSTGQFAKENTSGFTILGQVNLGFWLNKRNKN